MNKKYPDDGDQKNHLIELLRSSRDRLTPLIDDIVVSTVNLWQTGANHMLFAERNLTLEQYEDMVRAFVTLKEVEDHSFFDPRMCQLPNTNVIVNHVSVENLGERRMEGNHVVIDEATIVELLELYEKMGEVIRRLSEECERIDLAQLENAKSKEGSHSKHSMTGSHPDDVQKSKSAVRSHSRLSNIMDEIEDDIHRSKSGMKSQSRHSMTGEDVQRSKSGIRSHSRLSNIMDEPEEEQLDDVRHSRSAIKSHSRLSNVVHETEDDHLGLLDKMEGTSDTEPCSHCKSKNIMIKIMCNVGDSEEEDNAYALQPVTSDSDCYKVRLGEEPVSLRLAQDNVDNGATYCINAGTGDDEQTIKIVVKQCPQCHSTLLSSSTKIDVPEDQAPDGSTVGYMSGEITGAEEDTTTRQASRSSVRKSSSRASAFREPEEDTPSRQASRSSLRRGSSRTSNALEPESGSGHQPSKMSIGRGASKMSQIREMEEDQQSRQSSKMSLKGDHTPSRVSRRSTLDKNEDTSDFPHSRRSHSRMREDHGEGCAKGCAPKIIINISPSTCNKVCACDDKNKRSQPKMDVLLDVNNVDKSSIQVLDDTRSELTETVKKAPSIKPLTRGRICSSMEFDVTTVDTRLRQTDIDHNNKQIVVQLKNMGVDHLLRACRPAKCCRKAILNEKQRTALPYCVSLRSLPLLANDVQVIQQSYDMSVRKIKNSLDLSAERKEKFAYYVTLDNANINFPWVIPVYDANIDFEKLPSSGDDMFILKKPDTLTKSVSHLLKVVKGETETEKFVRKNKRKRVGDNHFYLLKKPRVEELTSASESSCLVTPKRKLVRKPIKNNRNRNQMYKIAKCNRAKKNFLLKKTCRAIGYEETTRKKIFYQETTSADDALLDFSRTEELTQSYSISESFCAIRYKESLCLAPNETDTFAKLESVMKLNNALTPKSSLCGDSLRVSSKEQVSVDLTFSEMKMLTSSDSPSTSIYLPSTVCGSTSPKRLSSKTFTFSSSDGTAKSPAVNLYEQYLKNLKKKSLNYYIGLTNGEIPWRSHMSRSYNAYYNYADAKSETCSTEKPVQTSSKKHVRAEAERASETPSKSTLKEKEKDKKSEDSGTSLKAGTSSSVDKPSRSGLPRKSESDNRPSTSTVNKESTSEVRVRKSKFDQSCNLEGTPQHARSISAIYRNFKHPPNYFDCLKEPWAPHSLSASSLSLPQSIGEVIGKAVADKLKAASQHKCSETITCFKSKTCVKCPNCSKTSKTYVFNSKKKSSAGQSDLDKKVYEIYKSKPSYISPNSQKLFLTSDDKDMLVVVDVFNMKRKIAQLPATSKGRK